VHEGQPGLPAPLLAQESGEGKERTESTPEKRSDEVTAASGLRYSYEPQPFHEPDGRKTWAVEVGNPDPTINAGVALFLLDHWEATRNG
jgi:hypothetical protein